MKPNLPLPPTGVMPFSVLKYGLTRPKRLIDRFFPNRFRRVTSTNALGAKSISVCAAVPWLVWPITCTASNPPP